MNSRRPPARVYAPFLAALLFAAAGCRSTKNEEKEQGEFASPDQTYTISKRAEEQRKKKEKLEEKKLERIRRSAEAGNSSAQIELGKIYFNGDDQRGIDKDLEKAAEWFRRAAEQGNPSAQFN